LVGYAEHVPSPALRPLVACTWAFSGPGNAHRVLPDGCIDIVVLGDQGARVVGTMRHASVVPPQRNAVLGIRFRPGEAARLFPGAPRELTDSQATLDDLWGEDGRVLAAALVALVDHATRHQLGAAAVLRGANATIEDALRRRLASHGEAVDLRVRIAAELLASGTAVREAAAHVGLSERQLGRRFADRVGLPPKAFARVMRLQRAATFLAGGTVPSEAASLAGYADQAHFSRDSAELAGISPGALAREVSDSFNTAIPVAVYNHPSGGSPCPSSPT
jgi:AraC-like DNA-binding protein